MLAVSGQTPLGLCLTIVHSSLDFIGKPIKVLVESVEHLAFRLVGRSARPLPHSCGDAQWIPDNPPRAANPLSVSLRKLEGCTPYPKRLSCRVLLTISLSEIIMICFRPARAQCKGPLRVQKRTSQFRARTSEFGSSRTSYHVRFCCRGISGHRGFMSTRPKCITAPSAARRDRLTGSPCRRLRNANRGPGSAARWHGCRESGVRTCWR